MLKFSAFSSVDNEKLMLQTLEQHFSRSVTEALGGGGGGEVCTVDSCPENELTGTFCLLPLLSKTSLRSFVFVS